MNLTPSPASSYITPIDPVIWKFIFILYNTLSVIPLPRRLEEKRSTHFNSFEIKLKRLFLPPYVISDHTPPSISRQSLSLSIYI